MLADTLAEALKRLLVYSSRGAGESPQLEGNACNHGSSAAMVHSDSNVVETLRIPIWDMI